MLPNLWRGVKAFIAESAESGLPLVDLFSTAEFDLALLLRLSRAPSLSKPSVPSIAPGTNSFTLIPTGPHSTASTFVIESFAAFAPAEWTYAQDPFQ